MKTEIKKEMFEEPAADVVVFESADVITVSGILLPDDEF